MLNNLLSSKKKDTGSPDASVNDDRKPIEDISSVGSAKKVVLVTGGSAGIGKRTAIEFARLGFKVAITGRDKDRLKSVWEKMLNVSANHISEDYLILQTDFEDMKQVESIVDHVVKTFGQLDVLVNNAGYLAKNRCIKDNDFFEDFLKVQQVNLHAPIRLCQLAIPHLIETEGVIINVSSIADTIPMHNISYGVSKAGLSMMTKCLANSLVGKNVRAVGVSPGPTETNFTVGMSVANWFDLGSFGRLAKSKEIAETIIFLASKKASFIHGTVVTVDGGLSSRLGAPFKPPKFLKIFS